MPLETLDEESQQWSITVEILETVSDMLDLSKKMADYIQNQIAMLIYSSKHHKLGGILRLPVVATLHPQVSQNPSQFTCAGAIEQAWRKLVLRVVLGCEKICYLAKLGICKIGNVLL